MVRPWSMMRMVIAAHRLKSIVYLHEVKSRSL